MQRIYDVPMDDGSTLTVGQRFGHKQPARVAVSSCGIAIILRGCTNSTFFPGKPGAVFFSDEREAHVVADYINRVEGLFC